MNDGRRILRMRLGVLGATAVAVAMLAGGISPAAATETVAQSGVLGTAVDQRPASVREYWSARRLRRARPADLALTAGGRVVPAAPRSRLRQRRASGGRDARTAVDTSAASSTFPASVHGKVFFTISGGSDPGDFVCSATAVTSNQRTLAWTAGHCVNDAQFGGGFATNWTFIPGYLNGEEPFGSWPAAQLFTTTAWSEQTDIRQDLGAARLVRDPNGRGIEDAVGARPIQFGRSRTQQYAAFGYPAEPTLLEPTFDGQRLYSCDSAVTGADNPPGNGPDTVQIDCDMSGGASGGGWVNAAGAVNGLTSYGYQLDFQHLYGPYFGNEAEQLYEQASGPALLCGGGQVTNLGGAGPNDFTGTEAAETFKVKGDADRARAFGGADVACGGGGDDRLKGGDADDTLRGGDGADVLNGGPGFDLCIGGPGEDRGPGCEQRRQIP